MNSLHRLRCRRHPHGKVSALPRRRGRTGLTPSDVEQRAAGLRPGRLAGPFSLAPAAGAGPGPVRAIGAELSGYRGRPERVSGRLWPVRTEKGRGQALAAPPSAPTGELFEIHNIGMASRIAVVEAARVIRRRLDKTNVDLNVIIRAAEDELRHLVRTLHFA